MTRGEIRSFSRKMANTGDGVPSIFWEDRNLMTVRLKRLSHPRAWSQKTAWGTNHVIGNVTIGGNIPLTTRMLLGNQLVWVYGLHTVPVVDAVRAGLV